VIDVSEAWAKAQASASRTDLGNWVPKEGFEASMLDAPEPAVTTQNGYHTYTATPRDGSASRAPQPALDLIAK